MKINAVNNSFKYMNSTVKSQNFKGLLGDKIQTIEDHTYYDAAQNVDFGSYDVLIEQEYFPFLDESNEEIEKIKEKYHKYNYREATDTDPSTSSNSTIVKVMPRIPVTAEEYNAYAARELLSLQEQNVEDKLKLANMQRFLNVPPIKIK